MNRDLTLESLTGDNFLLTLTLRAASDIDGRTRYHLRFALGIQI